MGWIRARGLLGAGKTAAPAGARGRRPSAPRCRTVARAPPPLRPVSSRKEKAGTGGRGVGGAPGRERRREEEVKKCGGASGLVGGGFA